MTSGYHFGAFMTRIAFLALFLSAACRPINESSFPIYFAVDYCDQLKTCDEAGFSSDYPDGIISCRNEVSEDVGDRQYGDGTLVCRWQEEDAKDCMDRLAEATCSDVESSAWYESCVSAWDCIPRG